MSSAPGRDGAKRRLELMPPGIDPAGGAERPTDGAHGRQQREPPQRGLPASGASERRTLEVSRGQGRSRPAGAPTPPQTITASQMSSLPCADRRRRRRRRPAARRAARWPPAGSPCRCRPRASVPSASRRRGTNSRNTTMPTTSGERAAARDRQVDAQRRQRQHRGGERLPGERARAQRDAEQQRHADRCERRQRVPVVQRIAELARAARGRGTRGGRWRETTAGAGATGRPGASRGRSRTPVR